MPLSSPSTMPASSGRRSPVVPRARVDSTCARNRSATPPIPPRRPTTRGCSPRSTTWTPRRASQPRSSKPVSGPRGSTGRARSSRTEPCGGARSGRQLEKHTLAYRGRAEPKHLGRDRNANGVFRAGPVTTTARRGSVTKPRYEHALRRAHPRAATPTTGRHKPGRPLRPRAFACRRSTAPRRRALSRPLRARSAVAAPRRTLRCPAHAASRRAGRASSPRRCVASTARASRRHQVAELLHPRGPDAGDVVEILDRAEGPVRSPPVDDLLRRDRTDARELVELVDGGDRKAHLRSRRRRARYRRRPCRHPARHDDLLSVGQRRREVDDGEVGTAGRPARAARARRQPAPRPLNLNSPGRRTAPTTWTTSRGAAAPPAPPSGSTRASGATLDGPSLAPTPASRDPATVSSASSGTRTSASCARVREITLRASPSARHRCVPASCRMCARGPHDRIDRGRARAEAVPPSPPLDDDVDEPVGHDDRPLRRPPFTCARTRSEASANATSSSSGVPAGTRIRSRSLPFT